VELLVTMVLMSFVGLIFGVTLNSMQRTVAVADGRSQRNDALRLAVGEIDRQIRSGNVFYDPKNETDPSNDIVPNMSLRVYTQANAPSSNPGNRCVQWRITAAKLQTRQWAPADFAGTVSPWRTVTADVTNRSAVPNIPAFTLDATPGYGSRLIKIRMVSDRIDDAGKQEEVTASVTGRNTQYGYPNNICDIP
ncbi:MAG TPA: hypothetical protein VKJ07_14910, partial [Mycobacteriales bacterium]|nr:hypothetical protein [Mycobacteriales bacterium]